MSSHGRSSISPRVIVNPILKKLTTQNEENSVDLDRPAELQDVLKMYDFSTALRASYDVGVSPTERHIGYHHRSTSGTSQFSIATAGSGQRTGSFVHPFQQLPRPYTPPVLANYQDSPRASEHGDNFVEDEIDLRKHHYYTSSISTTHRSLSIGTSSPVASQSLVQRKRSTSRLGVASSYSSLQNQFKCNELTSLSDSVSQPSVGVSMERGFRLRSRSEVIRRDRAQSIQEARRKFIEKEMVKEEKAAREEIKQLEKRQQKEAMKIDRIQRQSSVSDATRSKRSVSDLTIHEKINGSDERVGSPMLRGQSSIPEEIPEPRCNVSMAKHKTHSAWAKFVMWLRIRLMRTTSSKAFKR